MKCQQCLPVVSGKTRSEEQNTYMYTNSIEQQATDKMDEVGQESEIAIKSPIYTSFRVDF